MLSVGVNMELGSSIACMLSGHFPKAWWSTACVRVHPLKLFNPLMCQRPNQGLNKGSRRMMQTASLTTATVMAQTFH